jgi:hypothetical protein
MWSLLMRPQPRQRGGAVHVGRRAVGLERGVQVVSRLREQRQDVASDALRRSIEECSAPFERRAIV